MSDFLQAIQTGVELAQEKERNFKEILSIFETVKSQLFDYSKGKVDIELLSVTNGVDYFVNSSFIYVDRRLFIGDLVKKHPIATIIFEKNGYPCTFQFGEDVFTALDKAGVEEHLKFLLASPKVGQIIFNALKS